MSSETSTPRRDEEVDDLHAKLGHRPRLLIAEDDAELRSSLVDGFKAHNYDVRDVASGSALLEHLEPVLLAEPNHWDPETIITDVKMPGLDAITLVEGLQYLGWDIPVVVMTGFGSQRLQTRLEAMSTTRYLEKPVDWKKLETIVQGIIRSS